MKEHTLLDHIEFRLSSPSSRCELFISSDGETEKMASGFLGTFLQHLRAAHEQCTGAFPSVITLKGPPRESNNWFTKGTLERFVHFVSTPELLERVKTVEDELVQLEQVRSIQASSLIQIKDTAFGSSDSVLKSDVVSNLHQGQCPSFGSSNEVEASKRQLLQAMDVRLCALRQEQQMVFSRAIAAGFNNQYLLCLIAFSEFFGADRLHSACTSFVDISRKRRQEDGEPVENGLSKNPTAGRGEAASGNLACNGPHGSSELQGNTSKNLPQRTSPRRRSMSPLKKVQVGRFGSRRSGSIVVRSINYFSCQAKDTRDGDESNSSDSDDCARNSHSSVSNPPTRSSPLPNKRISVQAAINLFEGRQQKGAVSAPGKSSNREEEIEEPNVPSSARHGGEVNYGYVVQNATTENSDGPKENDRRSLMDHLNVASLTHDSDQASCVTFISNLPPSQGFADSNPKAAGSISMEMAYSPSSSDPCSTITCLTGMEKSNLTIESTHYSPTFSTSTVHGHRKLWEQSSSSATYNAKLGGDDMTSSTITEWESSKNSWIVPDDLNIQALADMVNHPISDGDFGAKHEGRFYEQYRKMRDAKLMEEQKSKRAEREARLRLMEETLELRKAEMEARTAKLSKENNVTQVRAAKLLALKANLNKIEKTEDDSVKELAKESGADLKIKVSYNSPPSPPLTPKASKEHAIAPKLRGKKSSSSSSSKKSTTTSRASVRAASESPKSPPRGGAGRSANRSSASSCVTENPLSSSVPCFSDLKKESAKSAPGKSSGSTRTTSKSRATNKNSPESNSNVTVQNGHSKRVGGITKKKASYNRSSEAKVISTTDEEMLLLAIKDQKEGMMEAPFPSKIRRSAVAPVQDVKPFLRKGSGIGPGAGPGVMKLKAFSTSDAGAKSSDDDASATPLNCSDEDIMTTSKTDKNDTNYVLEEAKMIRSTDPGIEGTEGKNLEDVDMIIDPEITHHSDDGWFPMSEPEKLDVPLINEDEMPESERCCHTISFPIDIGTHERYAAAKLVDQSEAQVSSLESTDSTTPFATTSESTTPFATTSERTTPFVTSESTTPLATTGESTTPFATISKSTIPFATAGESTTLSATASECAASGSTNWISDNTNGLKLHSDFIMSNVNHVTSDHCITSYEVTAAESSLGSSSWNNLSSAQNGSEARAPKKTTTSSQKPVVVVVPPKEPAKGLKRFLKFARKTRAAPEIIIADCLSASTASEGDDESEECKVLDRRHKHILSSALNDDHEGFQRKSTQPLRSFVPVPPSNFKLQEDHSSGSNRQRGGRSFFSLSTFRGKAGEGKSR